MTSPPRRQSFSQFAGIARSDSHSAGSIIIICKRYAPLGPHTQSPAQVPSGNNKNWLHRIKHRLSTFVKIVRAASLGCSLRAATNGDPLVTETPRSMGRARERLVLPAGNKTRLGHTGRANYQCLQGDCPERHQLLQRSSNRGQFRVPSDGIHPPQPQPRRQTHGAGLKAGGRAGQDHEPGGIGLRTAGRREVRLEIGMRLEPFLAASECDRYPIRHARMTTSIVLHYPRSASDQDAHFVRAHRCLRTSMDSGAKAVRAAPRSLHSS